MAAFVTKPDNKVSRVLKQLLAEVPLAMEGVSSASLAASLALAQVCVCVFERSLPAALSNWVAGYALQNCLEGKFTGEKEE